MTQMKKYEYEYDKKVDESFQELLLHDSWLFDHVSLILGDSYQSATGAM